MTGSGTKGLVLALTVLVFLLCVIEKNTSYFIGEQVLQTVISIKLTLIPPKQQQTDIYYKKIVVWRIRGIKVSVAERDFK